MEGLQIAKFQLAVDRFVQEGAPKQVDYIDVTAWRRLAEICGQYLKKGKTALVEGRIQIRTFEDGNGARKWATEVVARNIKLIGEAVKTQPVNTSASEPLDEVPGVEELPAEESDLPF